MCSESFSMSCQPPHSRAREGHSCLCVYDRWARQVCGQPVIQPKAGAVKSARERIIKLLVDVRVDATRQTAALGIFQ